MTTKDLQTKRAWFQDKLKERAATKDVVIDGLSWRDDATHEASQLTVASSGKTKTFPINDAGLLELPPGELEDWAEKIVQSFKS